MSMLKGKTALVTGSTSGIGLGIAVALARQGANIVLNGFGDVEAPKAQIQYQRTGCIASAKPMCLSSKPSNSNKA